MLSYTGADTLGRGAPNRFLPTLPASPSPPRAGTSPTAPGRPTRGAHAGSALRCLGRRCLRPPLRPCRTNQTCAPWRIRLTDELRGRFVEQTPPGYVPMLEAT